MEIGCRALTRRKRAQLRFQHFVVPEQQPDASLRQRGIAGRRQWKVGQDLVAAEIYQPEDQLPRVHPLRRALEELILLLLWGRRSGSRR